jgi:hypothetical protein
MACSQRSRLLAIVLVSCGLTGCGMVIPELKEPWDHDYPGDETTNPPTPPISGTAQIEFEIKKQIYCELKRAVKNANHYIVTDTDGKHSVSKGSLIPSDWGAQISLTLEVDESSSLNPGLTLNTPIHNATTNFVGENLAPATAVASAATYPFLSSPQSYAFGLGGNFSSTATRIDKFDPYYSIAYLLKPITSEGVCNTDHPENDPFVHIGVTPAKSSPLIVSDLGLSEWLIGALFTNVAIPSVQQAPPKAPTPASLDAERAKLRKEGYTAAEITQILASKASASSGSGGGSTPKPDTLSIEIKFIIVSNGNLTPTWHLVRVSANTAAAPFFGVGRTRNHDLIITIGPPNSATASTHLASQIGNSVSSGNRASVAAQ